MTRLLLCMLAWAALAPCAFAEPAFDPRKFRAVTHYWITRERVNETIEAIQTLLS